MTDMTVANTILAQLGGNKFIAMTGAKQFVGDTYSLTFRLPARFATNKANIVKIELNGDDTYTMTFMKLYKLNIKTISTHPGLYCDMLQAEFTKQTGLDTVMPKVVGYQRRA